jgi:hypothetical protein
VVWCDVFWLCPVVLCCACLFLVLFLGERKDLLGYHSEERKWLARGQDGRPGQNKEVGPKFLSLCVGGEGN